jgi:membrane peptidoglycan carboxypeptidase
MDRVMKRSDRILRRMVAARMISREEFDAAMAEVPNLEGIVRKVEKTLETPLPEEKPPEEAPGGGPVVIESSTPEASPETGSEVDSAPMIPDTE